MTGSACDPALDYDPFEGERDVMGVRTLRNGLIRTRKDHDCHMCACCVPSGTRGVRRMAQVFDGEIGSWWWCPLCVDAMRRDEGWYSEELEEPEIGPWVEEPPTYRRSSLGFVRRKMKEAA